MSPKLKTIATITVSLGLGIFLIWLVMRDFGEQEITEMREALIGVDYFWLFLSALLGAISHISRAVRWNYTLKPIGLKTDFINRWFSVMINYLMNLAFPRMGEVTRCAYLSSYENIPFDKTFGTLITERVLDFIILGILILIFLFFQYNLVFDFVFEKFLIVIPSKGVLISLILLGLLGIAIVAYLFKYSKNSIVLRVKKIFIGLKEGVLSIAKLEKKVAFIVHTLLIWALYIAMFSVCFFALNETSNVPFIGILGAFILGGLSMIATQGGFGAYPLAISQILLLYGVAETTGYAFGWAVWVAQTLMVLVLGLASIVLMPLYNKKRKKNNNILHPV